MQLDSIEENGRLWDECVPLIPTEAGVRYCLHEGPADTNISRTGQSSSFYLRVMTLNPTGGQDKSYVTMCLICCQKGTFNTVLHSESATQSISLIWPSRIWLLLLLNVIFVHFRLENAPYIRSTLPWFNTIQRYIIDMWHWKYEAGNMNLTCEQRALVTFTFESLKRRAS